MNSKVMRPTSAGSYKFVRSLALAGAAGLAVLLSGWLGPKLWNTTVVDLVALQARLVSLFGTYQEAAKPFSLAGLLVLMVSNAAMAFRLIQRTSGSERPTTEQDLMHVGRANFWLTAVILTPIGFIDNILYWAPRALANQPTVTNLDYAAVGASVLVMACAFMFLGLCFSNGEDVRAPVFIGRADRAKLCALTIVFALCFLLYGFSLVNVSAFVALAVLLYCNRNLHKLPMEAARISE